MKRSAISPRRRIGEALRTNLVTTEQRIGAAVAQLAAQVESVSERLSQLRAQVDQLTVNGHQTQAAVAEVSDQIKRLAAQTQEQQFGHGTYLGDELVLAAHPTGLQMLLDATCRTITPYIIGGKYERDLALLWLRLVRPGDVILEIGANQGYHTLALALRTGPNGHVAAYEPNPRTARILELNLVMSGFGDRATAERFAVSDADGRARFHALEESPGGSRLSAATGEATGDQPGTVIDVETRSVATVLDMLPGTPNLVKIDAEGYEIPIVRALLERLPTDRLPVFVVECIPGMMAEHGGVDALAAMAAEHHLSVLAFQDRLEPVEVGPDYLRQLGWEDVLLVPRGFELPPT